jgi:hypothetical protein
MEIIKRTAVRHQRRSNHAIVYEHVTPIGYKRKSIDCFRQTATESVWNLWGIFVNSAMPEINKKNLINHQAKEGYPILGEAIGYISSLFDINLSMFVNLEFAEPVRG